MIISVLEKPQNSDVTTNIILCYLDLLNLNLLFLHKSQLWIYWMKNEFLEIVTDFRPTISQPAAPFRTI